MEYFDLYLFVPSLVSALIVGGLSFYFFKLHTETITKEQQFKLRLEARKTTLTMRIQAYERLTLFSERISLVNLLTRVRPISQDKQAYEDLLIKSIDQEYEHNLVQQIYVSEECWGVIKTAKNSIINRIRKTNMSEQITDANKLRETLLLDLLEQKNSPSSVALQVIKKEMKSLL
jgi:hypothetical protein